jgi:hypothetical protein
MIYRHSSACLHVIESSYRFAGRGLMSLTFSILVAEFILGQTPRYRQYRLIDGAVVRSDTEMLIQAALTQKRSVSDRKWR